MKMLYFSSDPSEVEQVRKELITSDIPCEVRNSPPAEGLSRSSPCTELWIRDDNDAHRALMRCVELGVGFARRPDRSPLVSDSEEEFPPAWAA
jgi:hypothetical protein